MMDGGGPDWMYELGKIVAALSFILVFPTIFFAVTVFLGTCAQP